MTDNAKSRRIDPERLYKGLLAGDNPYEPGRAELLGACTGWTGLGDYCDTCAFHEDEHARHDRTTAR